MKGFNLKSKKTKVLTVSAVVVAIACICAGFDFARNATSNESKTIPTAKSSITTMVHTTAQSTTLPIETPTKGVKTSNKKTTNKSNLQKNSSIPKQSNFSEISKRNNGDVKQTTKKNNTTSKKETTTKAKSYSMTKSEIRKYALDQIKKIDGTIYTPEFTKDNSGWYSPLIIEPGDSEQEIKESIRNSTWFYNGTTTNGYNVYVENSTYWHATISSSGEMKEYNKPCIKVYFLYGQIYTGPPVI